MDELYHPSHLEEGKMRTLFMTASMVVVFSLAGCGKKGGGAEKEFESYVNAVCACKDNACVADEAKKLAEKNKGKKAGDGSAKPSKKMVELTNKMTECTKKIAEEEAKKLQGGAGGGGGTPPAPEAPKVDWPKLTQEQCEKAARKWNIECRIQGTEPPKDADEMVKMVSSACMMGNDPSMYESSVPSRAQIACQDKADCKEYKTCVSDKEAELKAQLGK
jgi:hypothetical protein